MSIWTVKPETVTVDLTYVDPERQSHPFWIKLKKHLTVGETRRVSTAGWRGVRQSSARDGESGSGAEIQVDWRATSFARTEAYLIDWSLENEKHERLAVTRDVIETLSPDVFQLVEDAITAHVEAMEKEKKVPAGRSEPSPTSA